MIALVSTTSRDNDGMATRRKVTTSADRAPTPKVIERLGTGNSIGALAIEMGAAATRAPAQRRQGEAARRGCDCGEGGA